MISRCSDELLLFRLISAVSHGIVYPMYIVASVRKSGSRTYTYYNLVEGVRTPKGPRHRVILSLGKLDSIPADRIKLLGRLVDGRLSGQIRLLPAEAEEPVLQQEAERIAQLVVAKHAADPADEPPIAVRPETVSASEAVLLGPVYVGESDLAASGSG